MSAMSDYLELELLKYVTGQTNGLGTAPTPYLRLWTTMPDEAGAGGTEVTGGSYAAYDAAGDWPAPSAASCANNLEMAFTEATANWGAVLGVTLEDAATGGNMLVHDTFASSVTVNSGDTFRFAVSDFTITAA